MTTINPIGNVNNINSIIHSNAKNEKDAFVMDHIAASKDLDGGVKKINEIKVCTVNYTSGADRSNEQVIDDSRVVVDLIPLKSADSWRKL